MTEPVYSGNFDQQFTVNHVQLGSADDVDIDCGYISIFRKIVFNVSVGTVNLSFFNDAARTDLAYNSGVKNDGEEDISPFCFVDTAYASKIRARIQATPGAVISLVMNVTRLA